MKVQDIMTKGVCFVSPDTTLGKVSDLMAGDGIGVIPVCDKSGLVGMVTDRDIVVRGMARGYGPDVSVATVMSGGAAVISPTAGLDEAVRLMGERQVRRLPVVSEGKLVGMLSVGDIARAGRLDAEVAAAEEGIAEER